MRRSYVRAAALLLLIALISSLGILGFLYLSEDHYFPQIIGKSVRHVNTSASVVALTFDDGPSPPFTEEIMDLLAEYDAKATFFVIGASVDRHPDTVQRLYLAGHEIGNHSWDHTKLVLQPLDMVESQIADTDDAIRRTGYRGPINFRAPYGSKLLVLPYYLWRTNRLHVLYDVALNEYEEASIGDMLTTAKDRVCPGSIILLHDAAGGSNLDVTREILQMLSAEGYHFVTVTELLTYSQ